MRPLFLFALELQRLLPLLHVHVALQPADSVDEEHTVQVIDLVLKADGAQLLCLLDPFVAVQIEPADPDLLGPLHLGLEVGDREAALCPDDGAIALEEIGRQPDNTSKKSKKKQR